MDLNGCLWLGNQLSTDINGAFSSHFWLQEGKASAINHPPILPETKPMQMVQTIPRLEVQIGLGFYHIGNTWL